MNVGKGNAVRSTLEDDMGWLKGEIADVRACIMEIGEHLKGDD